MDTIECIRLRESMAQPNATAPVVKSFSQSTRDKRCLEVWFDREVTDDDRAWLLEAINEKAQGAWKERAEHAESVLAEKDDAAPSR